MFKPDDFLYTDFESTSQLVHILVHASKQTSESIITQV